MMRLRSRDRGRGAAVNPKRMIIKITSKTISVRNEPSRHGLIVCQLQQDFIVQVVDDCEVDEIKWLKINSGWICSRDSNGSLCYTASHEVEANKFWAGENVNRRRVASAISQLLAKGHSLTNARRVSNLLFKQSNQYVKNLKPLTNLPDVSIEDLVIALSTSTGLKAVEIFEFMKVAASQQSDPPKSLIEMATQVNDTINLRPSLWVQNDLGVLDTVDVVMKNDIFVMACARNDTKKFDECLAKGQELAAIHSDLKYTGLHAAADFGAIDIVRRLLSTGISPNVRDARHGRTALHFAAQSGRCEIAVLLLEKGADRSLTCFSGLLPCEIADDQGHAECREILKQVPPEIQYGQVINCTDTTITLEWAPPVTIPHLHAKIDEFMVIHEPIDPKHGPAQRFTTKERTLTVRNLSASTGHGFVILSHSVSGWSKASVKLIHFTLPSAPSKPAQVELLKVTKNGILIAWQPPEYENGGPIDLYQIEMTDKDMIVADYSGTDSDDDESRQTEDDSRNAPPAFLKDGRCDRSDSSSSLQSTFSTSNIYTPSGEVLPRTLTFECDDESVGGGKRGDGSKWHRLIKHRDISNLSKYVMGLETYRNYYFRCSCRNEFGWSPWGEWIGPFTPQEGVRVRQFGDTWIRLGWVEPRLGQHRSVDQYEVQMAMPSGPMTSSVSVYESKATRKNTKAAKFEFTTIETECPESEMVVRDLKPGKKYQFRVRPMISGEWVDWDLCVVSDVITMPSTAPDVPRNCRIMRRIVDADEESKPAFTKDVIAEDTQSSMSVREESDTKTEDEDDSASDASGPASSGTCNGQQEGKSDQASAVSMESEIEDIHAYLADQNTELAVTHNSIDIEWVNGVPNGSAIQECEVQCCKVREYMVDDLDKAKFAAGREESFDEIVYGTHQDRALNWENITKKGIFLSAQSFRAMGLISGASYTFRVRQRNDVHWSSYSRATNLVTTLIASPPLAPEIIMISSSHVVAQWRTHPDATFAFSALQYDVRIARWESEGSSAETVARNPLKDDNDLAWKKADVRQCKHENKGLDLHHTDRVIVDELTPMTSYVLKVRILTVAGWTTWSGTSIPFRTLSLP